MAGRRPVPSTQPQTNDSAPVSYLEARDRFLSRFPKKPSEEKLLRYYAEVGRYVLDRWHAEERDRPDGQPFNEAETDCRWDECTEKHLRDLSIEVVTAHTMAIRQARIRSLVAEVLSSVRPISGFLRFANWVVMESVRGFVGAIGILAFGLLLVWLAPPLTRTIRSVVDDLAPEATRPVRYEPIANEAPPLPQNTL